VTSELADANKNWELDPILPSQFYHRGGSETPRDGIRRLLSAILEDAVRIFQSVHPTKALTRRHQKLVHETEAWLFDRSASNPLSYQIVCESLGIDPDAFREGLLKGRRRCLAEGTLKKLPRRAGVRVDGRIRPQRKRRHFL
jgi:hypothetical protein